MKVLVIDVGGSHVKLLATGQDSPRRFKSGRDLSPDRLVRQVKQETDDWEYEVIALGYPGRVGAEGPFEEPGNLGEGWVGFDYEAAFGCPVRIVNDAVMQAVGAHHGGRMLFLGLGTGLGSALVADLVVLPLELGTLPYREGGMLSDWLGKQRLAEIGPQKWNAVLHETVDAFREAFLVEEIVLGGGQAAQVDPLPERTRRGGNEDAFTGGFRLWEEEVEHSEHSPMNIWRVVR